MDCIHCNRATDRLALTALIDWWLGSSCPGSMRYGSIPAAMPAKVMMKRYHRP